jgi:hypothetical protein
VKSVSLPIAGIVAAALLDNRLSWGTVASVLLALYCHRLYRRGPVSVVSTWAWAPDDELRPGWAARWAVSGQPDAGQAGAKWPEVG